MSAEREPLLQRPPKKPWYRPRPLWLVFCATISSLCVSRLYDRHNFSFLFMLMTLWKARNDYSIENGSCCANCLSKLLEKSAPSHRTAYPIQLFTTIVSHDQCLRTYKLCDQLRRSGWRSPITNQYANLDNSDRPLTLTVVVTTTAGLLSALSTGWWGQFGDYYGRTKVLAAAQFGVIFT